MNVPLVRHVNVPLESSFCNDHSSLNQLKWIIKCNFSDTKCNFSDIKFVSLITLRC